MGTFGTGPFGSDGAEDLLDHLASQAPADRLATVEHMLSTVLRDPDALMRTVFPDEIVACAALVAAGLPNGHRLHRAAGAAQLGPAPNLAPLALRALSRVAGTDGPWMRDWVDPQDANDAQQTIDALVAVLRSSAQQE